jgi:hypothetical protein
MTAAKGLARLAILFIRAGHGRSLCQQDCQATTLRVMIPDPAQRSFPKRERNTNSNQHHRIPQPQAAIYVRCFNVFISMTPELSVNFQVESEVHH